MSGAQRAFWVDLITMAGLSRFPGIICAGMDGDKYIGYPLSTFKEKDPGGELDIMVTLQLFVDTGKILMEVTSESPFKLFKITILNWDKYQSEYNRQKQYKGVEKQEEIWPSKEEKEPDPGPEWILPEWVPETEWKDFVQMRQRIKAPLTRPAQALTVRNLVKLKDQGHDPADVLNQSTQMGWRGVFPIKGEQNGNGNGRRPGSDSTQDHIDRVGRNAAALGIKKKPT